MLRLLTGSAKLLFLTLFFSLLYIPPFASGLDLPSSSRSQQAVMNVSPHLKSAVRQAGFKWGSQVFIRIFKFSSKLEIWLHDQNRYKLFKSYSICYYSGKLGPKTRQGDRQAPEGFYRVTSDSLNPNSIAHLSFNIGYPNAYDRSYNRTGSYIMVHGGCESVGCFAMAKSRKPSTVDQDRPIEEIWTLLTAAFQNGQSSVQVHIFPFRLTKFNLLLTFWSRWYPFWKNLKQGYDIFEKEKLPPKVHVQNKQYIISAVTT